MDFLQALNPEQREAVLQTGGPLLILAGAGSGKTRVIAYRIAYLVGGGLADPSEVLAVTFTNKAAGEMRERVERLLGADCGGIWISTFHALCARLLRRDGPAIGLPRDFVIYDTADQLAVVKQVSRVLGVDEKLLPPRLALARISHAKNTMNGLDPSASSWRGYRDEQVYRIYGEYQRTLENNRAFDFDDLLLKTVELLERSEATRARYASRFRFVMVDEYQDTNRPQYLLIRRLGEVHRNLCVVGDPDQSIYKWRGAELRNITDFEADFPDTRIVRLERNYRSTQVILDAATAVINCNQHRPLVRDKRLWTDRHGGPKVRYFRGADELDEADFIRRTARAALQEDPEAALAILYRTNAQSRAIEDALMRDALAYRIIGGVRFYERREIKDALAYLRLLLNPADDVSVRRVINVPPRGIGKAMLDQLDAPGLEGVGPLLAAAPAARPSLWTSIEQALDAGTLAPRATASLKAFHDLVAHLAEVARHEPVSRALVRVLDESGYLRDLREERSEEAEGRIENLEELVSAAREYESREPEPSLSGFVDRLSLLSEADEEDGDREARISLMTVHAAKGLEFPVVVIAGLEEGLFPHSRASHELEDLEEERRLCYVAMTRARARLILTGAARRRVFGEYQASEPSRFVSEVPVDLIEEVPSAAGFGYASGIQPFTARQAAARRGRRDRVTEQPAYTYEDEDQSAGPVRPGARVRHPTFGLGTVLSVESLPDDLKLTVRFAAVGRKTLRAKYARLEPA